MKKKVEWSKVLPTAVVIAGFVIAQEAMFLMYVALTYNYSATAAWLTAAVGLAEALIGIGVNCYISLCKSDHSEGGITYEAAKAKNFVKDSEEGHI